MVGRVMSRTEGRACVSPDRGETETCVDAADPAALEGVDVGECAEVRALSELRVVDAAACVDADAGD